MTKLLLSTAGLALLASIGSAGAQTTVITPGTRVETTGSIRLTPQQRVTITRELKRESRVVRREPSTTVITPSLGAAVPSEVTLDTLPTEVIREVPAVEGYRYYVIADQLVLVDPATNRVVDMIPIGD